MAEEKKKHEKVEEHAKKDHAKKDHEKKEHAKVKKEHTKKDKPVKTKQKTVEIPKASDADVAHAFHTIKFVLMTEKSVRVVEGQNKLVFITRRNARRDEIKKAVETAFGSHVDKVTTMIDQSGRKKAFVRFSQSGAAGDIAIKLGII